MGKNIRSLSTEPHADRRPTYNGVRPGSPRGSLRHCCLYPSAMQPSARYLPAWLGQTRTPLASVLQQPPSGYTLHNCYSLPRDPGQSRVHIYDTPRYGRGVGFMGGCCVIQYQIVSFAVLNSSFAFCRIFKGEAVILKTEKSIAYAMSCTLYKLW